MQTFNDPSLTDDAASSTYPTQAVLGAQHVQRLCAAFNGTRVIYGCKVTLHSGGGAVDISAGRFEIDGVGYSLSAQSNVAVTNADASNKRVDQVTVTGNVNTGAVTVTVVAGTAASPYAVEKTVVTNSYGTPTAIVLATIHHVAAGGALASSTQIVDERVMFRNTQLANGWCADDNTWSVSTAGVAGTAASGSTAAVLDTQAIFTVAGDYRRRYRKGTRLRWYESGTEKWNCVANVSFASNTTTVTLMPASASTSLLTTAPDTDSMFYSHAALPEGYPDWFNYTPSFGGFSAYSTHIARWNVTGTRCEVWIATTGNFTSSSATHTVTAPVALSNLTGTRGGANAFASDNGTALNPSGVFLMTNNSTTITVFPTGAQTNSWTTSGNSQFRFGIAYEI